MTKSGLKRLCNQIVKDQSKGNEKEKEKDIETEKDIFKFKGRSTTSTLTTFEKFKLSPIFLSYGYFEDVSLTQRSFAGPKAPPSWRAGLLKGKLKNQKKKSLGFPSLQHLCIDSISIHLKYHSNDPVSFSWIPFYLKEKILEMSGLNGTLKDDQMRLFFDPEIRMICIAGSSISVEGLKKLEPRKQIEIPSTWEALVHEEDEDEEDNNESNEEKKFSIPKRMNNIVSVDISYCQSISGYQIAYVLESLCPFVRELKICGCFGIEDGPVALKSIAMSLPLIRKLDISDCFWATPKFLLSLDWSSCFQYLETIYAFKLLAFNESTQIMLNQLTSNPIKIVTESSMLL